MSAKFSECKHHVPWPFCDVCHQNSAAYIPQFDDSCGIKDTQIGYETPQKGEDNHAGGGSSSYYELPSDCQTLQDIIVKKGMDFTRGNIFKAVYRWDSKPSLQYNLEKIVWFAQDALNRIYAEQKRNLHGSGND